MKRERNPAPALRRRIFRPFRQNRRAAIPESPARKLNTKPQPVAVTLAIDTNAPAGVSLTPSPARDTLVTRSHAAVGTGRCRGAPDQISPCPGGRCPMLPSLTRLYGGGVLGAWAPIFLF